MEKLSRCNTITYSSTVAENLKKKKFFEVYQSPYSYRSAYFIFTYQKNEITTTLYIFCIWSTVMRIMSEKNSSGKQSSLTFSSPYCMMNDTDGERSESWTYVKLDLIQRRTSNEKKSRIPLAACNNEFDSMSTRFESFQKEIQIATWKGKKVHHIVWMLEKFAEQTECWVYCVEKIGRNRYVILCVCVWYGKAWLSPNSHSHTHRDTQAFHLLYIACIHIYIYAERGLVQGGRWL